MLMWREDWEELVIGHTCGFLKLAGQRLQAFPVIIREPATLGERGVDGRKLFLRISKGTDRLGSAKERAGTSTSLIAPRSAAGVV